MKVLLVEDDESSLCYLEVALKKEGIEYRTANDGKIGYEVFKEFQPDFILSDINMAEMTGIELLEKVKVHRPETIVVMLTAFNSEQYVVDAMKLGANNYLKKPILKDTFLAFLRKYDNIIQMQYFDKKITSYQKCHEFDLVFNTEFENIPSIVNLLVSETDGILSPEKQLDIRLGLSELLLNAVEHGNLGISFYEKSDAVNNDTLGQLYKERLAISEYAKRLVSVSYSYKNNICEWIITDQGQGFDFKSIPDPSSEEGLMCLHGRGIFICRFQFDEMEYIGCGNQVRVVKKMN